MRTSLKGWLIAIGVVALAGCATSSNPSKPATPASATADPFAAPTRSEILAAMNAGVIREHAFSTERLPQMHHQFDAAIARLDAQGSRANVRHQAQVDLREADFQANRVTVSTGVQINAIQHAAEPWLAQCAAPALKASSDCKAFVAAYDRWDRARQAVWTTLTGPVLHWRDAANAAIARHPKDPVVPVDYWRGQRRCIAHDLRAPNADTAI